MTTTWAILLSQMISQSPQILAYVIGIVICAAWWRRVPTAAAMALTGTAVLLFVTVFGSFLQTYLIQNRAGNSVASLSTVLAVLGIGLSVIRAGAFALVLAAVFAQRPRVVAEGFEVVRPGEFTASASHR